MTGVGSSCGACKFLRRRCTRECIFAPYFSYEQAATHFAAVHKVFGASNVSKLLLHLPLHGRSDAAITVAYEALARMHDPVYGCVSHIFALQQQVASLEEEIESIEKYLLVTSNNPYFVTQPDIITSNCSNQHAVPILYSENASTIQACYDNNVFENRTSDEEISQAYLDSIILETLLEEVNMHSPWIEIAEII